MSKKENKVSIGKLERLIEGGNITAVMLNDDTEMLVKKRIPFNDVLLFAEEVSSACVDGNNRRYLPEVRDFAIKRNIMLRYANFTLPENIDRQYELIYHSGVVDEILKYIDTEQLTEICAAIDRKVKFMLDSILSVEHDRLSSVAHQLEEMTQSASAMFGNTDISALTEALSKIQDIDEEKLVQAVLKSKENGSSENTDDVALIHKEE